MLSFDLKMFLVHRVWIVQNNMKKDNISGFPIVTLNMDYGSSFKAFFKVAQPICI
jgi:hypothetical protein